MRLEVEIANVVVPRDGNYFIALQIDYDDPRTPTQKFRTDLAPLAVRPKFTRNLFRVQPLIAHQRLKFGLMSCRDNSETSVGSAKLAGLASINLALDKLKTLPPQGHPQIVKLLSQGKEVGQLQCLLRFVSQRGREKGGATEKEGVVFNPLISRILFAEESTRDQLHMESSMGELQRQIEQLFTQFKEIKTEEETLQSIYSSLLKDEEELKTQVEVTQRINEKLALKLSQRESLQSLKMEIEMLRSSQEGRNLLCEKLQYFQDRIRIQDEQHRMLNHRYDLIRAEIDHRIQKAENYAQKLRSKDLQLFELSKNEQLLRRYDDVEYEFQCNQQIIDALARKSPASEMTANQAALLLSQVNHQLKLEQLSSAPPQDARLLQMIEQEAKLGGRGEQENLSEEQKMVLTIKLAALEEEASVVRNRLRKLLPQKR